MNRETEKTIIAAYRVARKRILFLDYDGTLVPFYDLPGESVMSNKVRRIVTGLASDPKNRVFIISGRDKDFLEKQFRGMHVGLGAEHGYLVREAGGGWNATSPIEDSWKEWVTHFFKGFCDRYQGSFVETKEASVAYHYRTAGKEAEIRARPEIRAAFVSIRKRYPGLELLDGDHVVEIKPQEFYKGKVAMAILNKGAYDFILGAGDDLTDETLFRDLPPTSVTIKIGRGETAARFCVPAQEDFPRFLRKLTAGPSGDTAHESGC